MKADIYNVSRFSPARQLPAHSPHCSDCLTFCPTRMNPYPVITPYHNYSYPSMSSSSLGNDATRQHPHHHAHNRHVLEHRNAFCHQSQSTSGVYRKSDASENRAFALCHAPSSTPAPVPYSRHPGGGIAPLIDSRNAHIPPLTTTHIHPNDMRITSEHEREPQHTPRRNRSGSGASKHSSTSRRRRSSQVSFTGPAARPTRKVIFEDPRCVMQSAHGTPLGPTNHVIVPQAPFFDEPSFESSRLESVSFQLRTFPELGVRVSTVLAEHELALVGGDDMVFNKVVYKEIKLKIVWPGYSRFPFERRFKTKTTRSLLLANLSKTLADFIRHIEHNNVPIEPGYERWKVGTRRPYITSDELFVTGLIHRGGPNWQPEIWCPSGRAIY
ncbi:hypothetical protein PM082_015907 [Marasmius tenuissimus]|nr:hypothetical protein PM082_015907 [Marasmius tenuissimus]